MTKIIILSFVTITLLACNCAKYKEFAATNCVEEYEFEPIKITYKNIITKESMKGDLNGFFVLGIGGINGSISGGAEKETTTYRVFLKDEYGTITPYNLPSEKVLFKEGKPSVFIKGMIKRIDYGLDDPPIDCLCVFLKRNIGTQKIVELVGNLDKVIISIPNNSIKFTMETEIGNYVPELEKIEVKDSISNTVE